MKSCYWCSFPSALFLSTRLTFNPHSFLLPSFLHQHILFTEVSIYQGLWKVDTTFPFQLQCQVSSSWVSALGNRQSLDPAVLLLPNQAVAQGEMERLHTPSFIASNQPFLSFPSFVLGPDSPAALCVNLSSVVGRTLDLGHPGREGQFPCAVENSQRSAGKCSLLRRTDQQELMQQLVFCLLLLFL